MALEYSRLGGQGATFQDMIQRFGVVTVMNAKVYDGPTSQELETWEGKSATQILELLASKHYVKIDTLKIANVTQEGPTKTVTGGQYSNPLIKFGKSARLEMQDALGSAEALDALCGTVAEAGSKSVDRPNYADVYALHVTEDFNGPKTIVGESFFIHQPTGKQVPVTIIFYQFLPDSIFNLTQDAEGDATVFDMNGDLLTTTITIKDINNQGIKHGVFYSIVDNDASDDLRLFADADAVNAAGADLRVGQHLLLGSDPSTATEKVVTAISLNTTTGVYTVTTANANNE